MSSLDSLLRIDYRLEGDPCADVYLLATEDLPPSIPTSIYIPPASYLAKGAHEIFVNGKQSLPYALSYQPDGYGILLMVNTALMVCHVGEHHPLMVLAWTHLLADVRGRDNPYALTGYALPSNYQGANTAGLVLLAVDRIKARIQ